MRPTADAEQRYWHLFDRCHRAVYGYCRRRTDVEAAADCVAETFLEAWRCLDDVPAGDAALGWLYGVARRTLANEYRRTRRWRRLLDRLREVDRVRDTTPEVVVRRERDRTVLAASATVTAARNTPWTRALEVETWNSECRSRSNEAERTRSTTWDRELPVCLLSAWRARHTLSETSQVSSGAIDRRLPTVSQLRRGVRLAPVGVAGFHA